MKTVHLNCFFDPNSPRLKELMGLPTIQLPTDGIAIESNAFQRPMDGIVIESNTFQRPMHSEIIQFKAQPNAATNGTPNWPRNCQRLHRVGSAAVVSSSFLASHPSPCHAFLLSRCRRCTPPIPRHLSTNALPDRNSSSNDINKEEDRIVTTASSWREDEDIGDRNFGWSLIDLPVVVMIAAWSRHIILMNWRKEWKQR